MTSYQIQVRTHVSINGSGSVRYGLERGDIDGVLRLL